MMNAGLGALAPNPANPMMGQPQQMQAPVQQMPMPFQQPPAVNQGLGAANPNPMASQPQPFQQLLALNEAVKAKNLEVAAQRQQAMEQAQQMPPTVKQQLEMALQQAMAQQSVPGMAGGGMVAFRNGGLTEDDLEGLDEDLVAEEEPWEREVRRMYGEEVSDPGAGSVWRAIGRALTYNSDVAAQREREAQERAIQQAYQDPSRARDVAPPAGLAAAAATPSAGSTPPARPAGTGAGLGAAAPQYDELTQMRRMYEQLAKDVEGSAAVDPRVVEARQAYDAMLKASMDPAEQQMRELEARQKRGLLENPEAIAAMLEGLAGAQTLGEGLARAGAGAAKARASGQKELRESQANLVRLRQELAKAEAEARLARAEKDVEGEQRAKLKAAEIRTAMNKEIYELRTRRISADASATAAANRPTSEERGKLSENQRALLLERAIDNVAKDTNTVALVARAKAEAARSGTPFNEATFRQQLVQRQFEALVAAAEGRTMSPTSGQASAAPGATRLRFDSAGNLIP